MDLLFFWLRNKDSLVAAVYLNSKNNETCASLRSPKKSALIRDSRSCGAGRFAFHLFRFNKALVAGIEYWSGML